MSGIFCAVSETINVIGTRPRLLIIRNLSAGPLGFNEMRRRTKLSSRTLAKDLRFLADHGLVSRAATYALTERAQGLLPVLQSLGEWGIESELVQQ